MRKASLKRLYDSIYTKFSKQQNFRDGEQINLVTRGQRLAQSNSWVECDSEGLVRGSLVVIEHFCILNGVMVTQSYTDDKIT